MKPFRSFLPLLLIAPAGLPLVAAMARNPAEPLSPFLPRPAPYAAGPQDEGSSDSVPAATAGSTDADAAVALPALAVAAPAAPADPASFRGIEATQLSSRDASDLLALDPGTPDRSRRLPAPPPPTQTSAVVRFGDTLVKIAQRYGLTIAELLRLNPGLDTARLVVGSQIQVAQSAPARSRMLLGLAPVGSGGLSWPELPQFGPPQRPLPGSGGSSLIWPAQGLFTSGYGWRWGRMHKGIDIANNVGTPIVAVADGRVTFAGWHDGGYGYLVEVTHDDGSLTRYAHNSRLLVREGDAVSQGQTISEMGSTGRSTGPHLHFEILPPGQGAVNPLALLPPRA